MRKLLRRPSAGTILGGLALIVAMSGVAVAAIPGANGTVTGCLANNGTFKLIDAEAGKTCRSGETTVRLAGVDATGKVANADRIDGKDSSAFATYVHRETLQRNYDIDPGECVFEGALVPEGVPAGAPVIASTTSMLRSKGLVLSEGNTELVNEDPVMAAVFDVCNKGDQVVSNPTFYLAVLG